MTNEKSINLRRPSKTLILTGELDRGRLYKLVDGPWKETLYGALEILWTFPDESKMSYAKYNLHILTDIYRSLNEVGH